MKRGGGWRRERDRGKKGERGREGWRERERERGREERGRDRERGGGVRGRDGGRERRSSHQGLGPRVHGTFRQGKPGYTGHGLGHKQGERTLGQGRSERPEP